MEWIVADVNLSNDKSSRQMSIREYDLWAEEKCVKSFSWRWTHLHVSYSSNHKDMAELMVST